MNSEERPPFDLVRVIEVVARHGVLYVLNGGVSGMLHGMVDYQTKDVDLLVQPNTENRERLADFPGNPFDRRTLEQEAHPSFEQHIHSIGWLAFAEESSAGGQAEPFDLPKRADRATRPSGGRVRPPRGSSRRRSPDSCDEFDRRPCIEEFLGCGHRCQQ